MELTRTEKKLITKKKRVLKYLLEKSPNQTAAARSAGVSYQTLWNWRQNDPEFDEQVENAIQCFVDQIENDTMVSASNTYDASGNIETHGSPVLKMFILNGRRANIYGQKKTIEIKGKREKIVVIPAFKELPEAEIVDGTES